MRYRRRKQMEHKVVNDCQAAFPTAQLVAALRALDAKSPSPGIGSNIGAGPDFAAEAFAGELGFAFAKDFGSNPDGLVNRTMFFDGKIMNMLDSGCKQLVILAAGLDARAWRLPRLDSSVKVFEVDVPRAMAYKAQKVEELGLDASCTRIVVNADLSDPSWTSKLLDAGFQPEQTSFFLLEGLMMYLPPGAPQALWRSVSSLMSSGSKIAGDSFVNVLSLWPIQHVLEKYGTKFTFEVGSKEELVQMLLNASLRDAEVLSVDGSVQQLPNDGNGDQAQADARRIAGVLVSVPSWPPHALDWVRGQVAEKGGAEQVVRIVVEDKMGFHGLKDSSVEHKARVCELLFRDGWQSKLEDIVRELPASSQRSKFRKAYDAIAMMYAVMRWKMVKRRPTDAYVVYVASKA